MINNYAARSLLALIVVLLTACEVLQPQQDVIDEVVLAKYKDIPLKKALNDLQTLFQKAKDETLYFYSPTNYRIAKNSIQTARAYARDPDRLTLVLKNIYKADKAINDGFIVKDIVEREMNELIQLRISLDSLDAKRIFPREDRSLVQAMTNLIIKVEKNKQAIIDNPESKADFDSDKKDLLESYTNFRMKIVKHKYLNRGESLMAEADNYDAKSIAPKSFEEASKARTEAVGFIEKNIENEPGVQQASEKFEFAAQRLLHIAREVDELIKLDKNVYENYVLDNEKRFNKISKALKTDLRDKSFDAQSTAMASSVRTLVRQKEKFALNIAELRAKAENPEPGKETDADQNQNAQVPVDTDTEAGPQRVQPELEGDAALKRQVADLTMQLESAKLQKSEMEYSLVNLQKKVKQLQAQLNSKQPVKKPVAKKPVTPKGKTEAEKKPEAKTVRQTSTKQNATAVKPAPDAPAKTGADKKPAAPVKTDASAQKSKTQSTGESDGKAEDKSGAQTSAKSSDKKDSEEKKKVEVKNSQDETDKASGELESKAE